MFDDIEWDLNAVGITLVAEVGMGIFMFSGSLGWETMPLWWKLTALILGAPVWYFVSMKVLNG